MTPKQFSEVGCHVRWMKPSADSLWWRGVLDMMEVQDVEEIQTKLRIHILPEIDVFLFYLADLCCGVNYTVSFCGTSYNFSLFLLTCGLHLHLPVSSSHLSLFGVHSQGSAAILDGSSHQTACCDSSLEMR